LNHKRWNLLPPLPKGHPLVTSELPSLIAQLLYNRGVVAASQVESFFAGDRRLSFDPFLLPDMAQAAARVYRAILGAEKIAIYGDFDADGITATALLMQGLSYLTPNIVPYIPHRINEGHGLKIAALENLRKEGVSLVITVDCGITGAMSVKRAKRLGIDVIITDHHTAPAELPSALAVINPKLPGSSYPFNELAGVGVAYKLLQAVLNGLGKESVLEEVTDLVALGTVADMTPLLGENRYLVKEGLRRMNSSLRLGLKELLTCAGISTGSLSSENITWTIAPRINTASRLDHALPSFELLTTDSVERAQELARWLEQKNGERQQMTTRTTNRARQQVLEAGLAPLLVVSDEDYPSGISGLVASRLVDEFYRPTVVIREGKRVSNGSCRSIPEFNIIEALAQCHDLFLEFGGHAAAAGFVMLTHNLDHLRERLLKLADTRLAGVDLRPRINIDAEIQLHDLTNNTYNYVQKLEPFGQGNPVPVLVSRKVRVINYRTMGATGDHLRLRLEQNGSSWDAVAFGFGENLPEIKSPLDIVYQVELDQWNGRSTLRLNILDFAPLEK
jgi:single-stranded-DNA-specific exonuclease